ncbi:mannose-1-phosphate guanylyltransferase [Carboxylicivirga sediminis]|uniref:mannose-1-phosphate guanylyltransferase n=1 Tax=Carboxylicivirga sediminis TaxID=2006564 RepID=A0A941IXS9_9BACT|nr:mannose-1-phosphate guanylyltransferase [Carboxylicivirga sediminis]MBR8535047.1 mannose-1-phosphate guanylyltransferase [Carboxylicivirga sediminis]
MSNDTYCVIMAGGVGRRFWPLSTTQTPKQFLDILGTGKSLLQQTFERFKPLCPIENILVVTNLDYKQMVLEQLPELKAEQVLAEPMRRNTAPCVALANAVIKKKNPDAKVVVTPSDHLIMNEELFRTNITNGLQFVEEKNVLLTLGLKPNRPETAYGYVQVGSAKGLPDGFNRVKTFTEKPNLEMARILVESGEFFWNSGIFIWSLGSIENAFHKHLREVAVLFDTFYPYIGTEQEEKALFDTYVDCRNISIDYGVMEKASNVYVQIVDFGWSDLGTWTSLHENSAQNSANNAVLSGKVLLYDTKDSIVHLPKGKVGVIQGLEGYIIVQSDSSLLICPKENEQQIRQFTTDLKTELDSEG